MKNLKTLTVLFLGLLSLTGCDGTGSPTEVIQTAYKAVMENDLELFRGTLADRMKDQYGNPVEMTKLKERFAPFNGFDVAEGNILHSEQKKLRTCGAAGWHTVRPVDIRRISEVEILGKTEAGTLTPISKAIIDCLIGYEQVPRKGGLCYVSRGQFCQISDLN